MKAGLSTNSALKILNDQLISIYKKNYEKKNFSHYFRMSLKVGILRQFLIAIIILFLIVVSEFIYQVIRDRSVQLGYFILFCNFVFIIFINFILITLGTRSRFTSIYEKFQLLIDDINHIIDSNCKGWTNVGCYPFVKIPFANSVNLQWTIRDNQLINLPVALLVEGDLINLRPGQIIFADCELDAHSYENNQYKKAYTIGQAFVSEEETDSKSKHDSDTDEKCTPKVIPMKSCVPATVTKTPIIGLIDEFFKNHSQNDVWLISVPERYIQFSVNALFIFVLVIFILNTFLHIIWFVLIGTSNKLQWSATVSKIAIISIPIHLPLLLSITMSNIIWKINCLRYKLERRAILTLNSISMESIPSSLTLSSSCSEQAGPVDVTMDSMNVSVLEYLRAHWTQITNQDYQFAKMIYSMGSLTSLCCIDKKGILADPIATPEKIFIYRKRHKHKSSSLINLDRTNRKQNQDPMNSINISSNSNSDFVVHTRLRSITTETAITSMDHSANKLCINIPNNVSSVNTRIIPIMDMNCTLAVPIILDMTRSYTHPYLPTFDDNRWERYMSSLKPVGLNILLNNCNPDVTDRYINFTDNMSAINLKNLNKSQLSHRCICALATQIGFKPLASERFALESTFAVCRKNEKLIDNNMLNTSNSYPLPVGSVFSTVVRDVVRNSYQLMSQGSADLLISMCSDYWDGKDISPLTSYDRTRVLDFYNRNIFSSYCIGFAYSPLFNKIKFNNLDDQFILQMVDSNDKNTDLIAKLSPKIKHCRSSMPFDNLVPQTKLNKTIPASTPKSTEQNIMKSEEINSLLKHQIFLGMVSLQADQVQSDVIDCINRLEQACIRFVFFSTDNQLRSRVFAERLGMESGWNCHISLAEQDDTSNMYSNIRKNSIKSAKKIYCEEFLKENVFFKRSCRSEPILHPSDFETVQITHSATLNEKALLVPNYVNEEPKYQASFDLDNLKNFEISDSITTSATSTKVENSYLGNPCDHFPEDKSKLPCGIKSIRPHLEKVDNVPLQVSLFTDCNPEVDHEMMSIMREYGEIICCCGSGLTVKNVSLFSSNDCAVAFVPILHKQCWRQHEIKPTEVSVVSKGCQVNRFQKSLLEEEPLLRKKFTAMDQKIGFPELSPINIACRLVALPCGLLLNRKTGFNLIAFITECHRLVKNTLSSVAFYCLCCANFVLLKFFFNLIILVFDVYYKNTNFHIGFDIFPLDFQIIYHVYIHAPVLALGIYSRLTMLGKPLKEPSRKRGRLLTYKQCQRFILTSIGRFFPSLLLCILTLIWNMYIFYSAEPTNSIVAHAPNATGSYFHAIPVVIGDFIFIQHNIYIVIISFVCITLEKPFWKFNYLKNYQWLLIAYILICLQFVYFIISWQSQSDPLVYLSVFEKLKFPLIFSTCGILIVLFFGCLATYWEIRALSVEHRLARLYFGTKLGMYSPV